MKKLFILAGVAVILGGCVTAKDYESRVIDINSLQQDKAKLETRVNALEQENTGLKTQLQTAQEQNTSLEKRAKTAEAERTALAAKLQSAEEAKAVLEKGLKAAETAKADLQKENTLLNDQINELVRQRNSAVVEKDKAITGLKGTYDSLLKELKKEIETGQVAISQLKDKLTLTMVEKVLFDSGSAEIKKNGKKVLDRVGEILKTVKDRQINIEGHTDIVPISPKLQQRFATNWELSTARATNVVRYLQEKAGLDPALLNASGFAAYRPIEKNDTEEGRAKNRRIEIILTPMDFEIVTK